MKVRQFVYSAAAIGTSRRAVRTAWVTASVVLAWGLVGVWDATRAQGQAPDARRLVSIPLATSGLVAGEGIRTTLTNLGTRTIQVQAVVFNADGALIEQEVLTVAPRESRSVEMGRSEVGSADQSAVVHTEIVARPADAPDLWMTSEVIDWSTGATRFVAMAGKCPSWMCGPGGNHNETMVHDRMN